MLQILEIEKWQLHLRMKFHDYLFQGLLKFEISFLNFIFFLFRDTIDPVKQSAALCLLRLHRTSPESLQLNTEWTARIIHLLNDQHLVRRFIDELFIKNLLFFLGCSNSSC